MTDYPEFIARSLVRSYSDSLRDNQDRSPERSPPRRMIEEAFIEEVGRQDALAELLQEAASNDHASAALKERYEELETAFKNFRDSFAEVLEGSQSPKAMSWSSLSEALAGMRAQYDAKSKKGFLGQSKRRFHRICEVIDGHSNALKMLPQGDKYTSLVTGSLEMIIQASVNHERIGEEFATALEEVDRIVAAVQRELTLYRAPHLEELCIQLCCKILTFIAFPLKWYSQKGRKRFLASFNENLSHEYKLQIDAIRQISDHIRRGAQLCAAQEVRSISELMGYLKEVQEFHQRENWRRNEEQWDLFHRAKEEQHRQMREDSQQFLANMSQQLGIMFESGIGRSIKQILDREAENFVIDRNQVRHLDAAMNPKEAAVRPTQEHQTSLLNNALNSRTEVDEASRVLDAFFSYGQFAPQGSEINTFAEADAVQRLKSWTSQTSSSILGIFGPASLLHESSTWLMASNYIQAAKAAGIPCISYFCNMQNEMPPEGRTRETIGLVALLYGIMKQCILYLPLEVDTKVPRLDRSRFEQLDGTLRTWDKAISLFKDLVTLTEPPFLLVAIHGLEILEHEATNLHLLSLMDILRNITQEWGSEQGSAKRVFKVLFTTSGLCHILGMTLKDDEILDMNRGGAAQSPGQARKGRRDMRDVAPSWL